MFAPERVDVRLLWVVVYPLGVGCIHLLNQKLGTFCLYLTYLILYPFLAAGWLVRKLYGPSKSVATVVGRITHPYTTPVYFLIVCVCIILLLNLENFAAIRAISIVLVVINYLLIVSGVRWAINPVQPINAIADLLHALCTSLKRKSLEKQTRDGLVKEAQNVILIHKHLSPMLERFERNAATSITFGFILYFVMLCGVTLISYAAIYTSLTAIGSDHIRGLSSGFFDCLLYSVSVLTTSPLGGVETLSQFSKTMYCLELLSTISLVTLFVSIFSIGLSIQDGSINLIVGKLAEIRAHLVKEIKGYAEDLKLMREGDPSSTTPQSPSPELVPALPKEVPPPTD